MGMMGKMEKPTYIKKIILYLIIAIIISQKFIFCSEAITFETSGRTGDCLLIYFKAKCISYKCNIPIFCPTFKHSEKFMLDRIEKKYNKKIKKIFNHIIYLKDIRKKLHLKRISFDEARKFVNPQEDDSYLYISDLYTNINFDTKDKNFLREIRKTIAPVRPIKKPDIPKNCISVAVHVRRGGGYDRKNTKERMLWKFPPDEYYIDQIKKLYVLLNNKKLHVHIFTDDPNPKIITEKYEKEINIPNITFSSRENGHHYQESFIEDLFSMTYYDCLIRPGSSFSVIAEKIGNFFIAIYYPDKVNIKKNIEDLLSSNN